MSTPYVPKRIFEKLPNVKLIAMVRNPVDRALSHYQHSARVRGETRFFSQAIKDEPFELADYVARLWEGEETNAFWKGHSFHSYQIAGYYAQQLEWYFEVFPREQLLIVRSEDYFADPEKQLGVAADYIGLSPGMVEVVPNPSDGRIYLKAPNIRGDALKGFGEPMKEETRQQLIEHFRPHNAALAELTGRDFQWDV
jgi:hypothetical protein